MHIDLQQANLAVRILKAVAHPLRLQIVARLCDTELHVGALATELNAPQSAISQQLRILRMSGLVNSRREDGFAFYQLSEPRLTGLLRCVTGCPTEPAQKPETED